MNETAPGGYYFWKWADNDLPGNPREIHSTLLRGEMHPAIQTFDARPLLAQLANTADEGAKRAEEWDCQVIPASSPEDARFVFVTCPQINENRANIERFFQQFLPLDLSGFDDQGGHPIPCVRPKMNCFITGGRAPSDAAYDITKDDLPVLIQGISSVGPEPWGELLNRRNGVVAIARGRRYYVEWRESSNVLAPTEFRQWRARDTRRLRALAGKDDTGPLLANIDPDYLKFSDTLKIFQSFLLGERRPSQYNWRELHNVGY